MRIYFQFERVGAVAGAWMLGVAALEGALYTGGHGDIGVAFSSGEGEFDPHWHWHAGAVVDGVALTGDGEWEASEGVMVVSSQRMVPSGLGGALGGVSGEIYVAGSALHQPNLGLAADELDPLDWVGDLTVTFEGLTQAPSGGAFSLHTTSLDGLSVVDVAFSSVSVGSTVMGNALPLTPGDHWHFEWAFTEVGLYEVELTWAGEHQTEGVISTTERFSFQVIPEPGTLLLGVLGLGWAMGRRVR